MWIIVGVVGFIVILTISIVIICIKCCCIATGVANTILVESQNDLNSNYPSGTVQMSQQYGGPYGGNSSVNYNSGYNQGYNNNNGYNQGVGANMTVNAEVRY